MESKEQSDRMKKSFEGAIRSSLQHSILFLRRAKRITTGCLPKKTSGHKKIRQEKHPNEEEKRGVVPSAHKGGGQGGKRR